MRQFIHDWHKGFRNHQPPQTPSSHAKVLGEAVDYKEMLGIKFQSSRRGCFIAQPLVDFIDNQITAKSFDLLHQRFKLWLRQHCACWIGG